MVTSGLHPFSFSHMIGGRQEQKDKKKNSAKKLKKKNCSQEDMGKARVHLGELPSEWILLYIFL